MIYYYYWCWRLVLGRGELLARRNKINCNLTEAQAALDAFRCEINGRNCWNGGGMLTKRWTYLLFTCDANDLAHQYWTPFFRPFFSPIARHRYICVACVSEKTNRIAATIARCGLHDRMRNCVASDNSTVIAVLKKWISIRNVTWPDCLWILHYCFSEIQWLAAEGRQPLNNPDYGVSIEFF